jgi:TPR repeat protein
VPPFSGAEIAGLLARGDWLFATGDVASARLLFERAADAGEAQAALRLGETFDPVYLDDSHLRGLQGDPGAAVFWYRHARDLGATGVASRLKTLEAKERRKFIEERQQASGGPPLSQQQDYLFRQFERWEKSQAQ